MPPLFAITGNILKRFIQAATLLSCLDPVRGEPTTYSLDRHPDDAQDDAGDRQMKKFLDSIALICATRKDGDTVSAATLEEWSPDGSIIRIARNSGLPEETLEQIREIVELLNDIAQKGSISPEAERQILVRIIELDRDKISHYLQKIQKNPQEVQRLVIWISENPGYLTALSELRGASTFLQWVERLPLVSQEDSSSSLDLLLEHVRWAGGAKWVYSRFIEATFKAQGSPIAPWVVNVYKLGRYAVASKVLLNFAIQNRSLFRPMLVEAVTAPSKQRPTITHHEKHLEATLRRSIGNDVEELTMRLSQHWDTSDPERSFRKRLPTELTVHAEMQLLGFYDHNQDKIPRTLFIGVSKKSCFLCYKVLHNHPLNFVVSACHQKLYLRWCPPVCTDNRIYKQYKKRINDLSMVMEAAVKHEIEQKKGLGTRRPVPLDSTAGVSLPSELNHYAAYSFDDIAEGSASGSADDTPERDDWHLLRATSPISAADVADLSTTNDSNSPQSSTSSGGGAPIEEHAETTSKVMTFHVKRVDDPTRQDLVAITDIVDPISGIPSWDLFCSILAMEQRQGVAFDEASEFLMVNQCLRVGSPRQFNACLEYLRNAKSWNNEALVYFYED